MWCVVFKNNSDKHTMFTNMIFETEKKAIEFKNKQKSMRKKHDCRVMEFDYKYFEGVKLNETDK